MPYKTARQRRTEARQKRERRRVAQDRAKQNTKKKVAEAQKLDDKELWKFKVEEIQLQLHHHLKDH